MWNEDEYKIMRMALQLARKGLGNTWPNPMVGAIVVKNHRVVGTGWHRRQGSAHAEIHALNQAGPKARGATLVVNLEPCVHYGCTPPCTEALIKSGISRVIAAMQDPNPRVAGKGFRSLRQAGIRVEVGLMQAEAKKLNEVFIKNVTTGLPFVVCKAAFSLDGKIATAQGISQWISSRPARQYAHQLRALAQAIIIGAETVRADNPRLNVRLAPLSRRGQPLRVLLEGRLPISRSACVFEDMKNHPVVLATGERRRKHHTGMNSGLEVWYLPGPGGRVDLGALLQRLAEKKIYLVMVEGGAEVHASFLGLDRPRAKLWADQIQFILAPKLIGGRSALGPIGGMGVSHPDAALTLKDMTWQPVGPDMLVTAKPVKGDG